jgi:pyruvate/2-oxoglutarate dehydrogenase complex dihydrolipoamide dehydrogenase (E3) component
VIISIGFKPDLRLARKFGLEINEEFGVIVNEYMKTSDDDIFAAGDCVAKRSYLIGDFRRIMLASTAMSQGRLAGSNLFSINILKVFNGTLGSFATKVGNVAVGATGLTETRAKGIKLEYCVGIAETVDRHPAKLPNASKMRVKLIFAKHSHILLGAQVSGGDSVGECINMLSVMIQKNMTDMEIDTLQIGTHPLLTPSPLAYGVINATVDAIMKWYS